jgi:hypothetical protein
MTSAKETETYDNAICLQCFSDMRDEKKNRLNGNTVKKEVEDKIMNDILGVKPPKPKKKTFNGGHNILCPEATAKYIEEKGKEHMAYFAWLWNFVTRLIASGEIK